MPSRIGEAYRIDGFNNRVAVALERIDDTVYGAGPPRPEQNRRTTASQNAEWLADWTEWAAARFDAAHKRDVDRRSALDAAVGAVSAGLADIDDGYTRAVMIDAAAGLVIATDCPPDLAVDVVRRAVEQFGTVAADRAAAELAPVDQSGGDPVGDVHPPTGDPATPGDSESTPVDQSGDDDAGDVQSTPVDYSTEAGTDAAIAAAEAAIAAGEPLPPGVTAEHVPAGDVVDDSDGVALTADDDGLVDDPTAPDETVTTTADTPAVPAPDGATTVVEPADPVAETAAATGKTRRSRRAATS